MKKILLLSAVLLGAASASQAGVQLNFGFAIPLPSSPVVVTPPAPCVVAPPVCAVPAPVVVCPPAVYYGYRPGWYGHRDWDYRYDHRRWEHVRDDHHR